MSDFMGNHIDALEMPTFVHRTAARNCTHASYWSESWNQIVVSYLTILNFFSTEQKVKIVKLCLI